MDIELIRDDKAYQLALNKLNEIFDAEDDTREGDEAQLLVLLIERYEEDNYSIDPPDPIETIRFRMEQLGLKQKDLIKILGYKSRVSEILSRKRKLNLQMIRNLHEKLGIPYEALIRPY